MKLFSLFVLFSCWALCFAGISKAKTNSKKLEAHGITEKMKNSISGMTKAGLSQQHIAANIQAHFPDKPAHAIHEMIVLTNAEKGNSQAGLPDTKKSNKFKQKAAKEKFIKLSKDKAR
jgi:hypothetical protein